MIGYRLFASEPKGNLFYLHGFTQDVNPFKLNGIIKNEWPDPKPSILCNSYCHKNNDCFVTVEKVIGVLKGRTALCYL